MQTTALLRRQIGYAAPSKLDFLMTNE